MLLFYWWRNIILILFNFISWNNNSLWDIRIFNTTCFRILDNKIIRSIKPLWIIKRILLLHKIIFIIMSNRTSFFFVSEITWINLLKSQIDNSLWLIFASIPGIKLLFVYWILFLLIWYLIYCLANYLFLFFTWVFCLVSFYIIIVKRRVVWTACHFSAVYLLTWICIVSLKNISFFVIC